MNEVALKIDGLKFSTDGVCCMTFDESKNFHPTKASFISNN